MTHSRPVQLVFVMETEYIVLQFLSATNTVELTDTDLHSFTAGCSFLMKPSLSWQKKVNFMCGWSIIIDWCHRVVLRPMVKGTLSVQWGGRDNQGAGKRTSPWAHWSRRAPPVHPFLWGAVTRFCFWNWTKTPCHLVSPRLWPQMWEEGFC